MPDRDDEMYRAAVLYYVQGESMDAIARQLGVSRSTVSRSLKQARDTGIVRISLTHPRDASSDVEQEFSNRFGVRAQVVSVRESVSDVARLDRVAKVAANAIGEAVEDRTTIDAVAAHLLAKPVRGCTLVQLNGAANDSTTGIDYVSNIASRFAGAFNAHSVLFPVPAFFDYASTRDAMWRERSIMRVRDTQRECSLAVFGVGSLVGGLPSHVYESGYFDDEDRAAMARDRVVGDVCTVLLRENGSWADIEMNTRASGLTPVQLRRIPRRIGVVSGRAKARPLLAALRARVMTDLIVDDQTARHILTLA